MLSLKNIMRANATSCIGFGGLFALKSSSVASLLSDTSPAPQSIIMILGLLLIVNGLHLLWASRVTLPNKSLILYFSIGDYIWAVTSLGIILSGIWITTTIGMLLTIAVAIVVGFFGFLQMAGRKAIVQN